LVNVVVVLFEIVWRQCVATLFFCGVVFVLFSLSEFLDVFILEGYFVVNVCGVLVPDIEDVLSSDKMEFRLGKFFILFVCSFLVMGSMYVSEVFDSRLMLIVMISVLSLESLFFFFRLRKIFFVLRRLDNLIDDWNSVLLSISRILECNHIDENFKRISVILPRAFLFTTIDVGPFLAEEEAKRYYEFCSGIYYLLISKAGLDPKVDFNV
jgi:hypothetical protein